MDPELFTIPPSPCIHFPRLKTTFFFCRLSVGRPRSGFAIVYALAVGLILLFLGTILHQLTTKRHEELHFFMESRMAVALAETGVSLTVRETRKLLETTNRAGLSPLAQRFTKAETVAEFSILPDLNLRDTFSTDLLIAAKMVDPSADLRIDATLAAETPSERDPTSWNDRVAKTGRLKITSTATYRGCTKTVVSIRPIWVGSILPPVSSKFSLRVQNVLQSFSASRFNTVQNDYDGKFIDGKKPLIVINHTPPDDPFQHPALASVQEDDKNDRIFEKRGWIWLGGGEIQLNLTAGIQGIGELFIVYLTNDLLTFKPISFLTPDAQLPACFRTPRPFSWDQPNSLPPRSPPFMFSHRFILDGFHDRSNRCEKNAMYEGSLFTSTVQSKHGANSSSLHLFGDAAPGHPSRTKVLGKVMAAFPRFSRLDVESSDPEADRFLRAADPHPTYFIPGLSPESFAGGTPMQDFLHRAVGGPAAPWNAVFPEFATYANMMTDIIERPYADLYNLMGERSLPSAQRTFPPQNRILDIDPGESTDGLILKNGAGTLYNGPVHAPKTIAVVRNRMQVECETVAEFWKRYYDPRDKKLRINGTVRVLNQTSETFLIPPDTIDAPLSIDGGGLIVLERGSIRVRGAVLLPVYDALTIVAPTAETVTLDSEVSNQINIVAPKARLSAASRFTFYGTLDIGDIPEDGRSQGGYIRYREIQDPTGEEYEKFYRVCVADAETNWYQ
ncbi:MAG: hypothetical protein WA705_01800 [Candidatus Ozemobacteraceae bacterium]